MPTVLAVVPGTPAALQGRHLLGDAITLEVVADPASLLCEPAARLADLLVLAGMSVDDQQEIATAVQQDRRWRLVPILYVMDGAAPGFAVPGSFRPEIDGLARGTLDDAAVRRRMRELAREGTAAAEFVVVGPYELDPLRGVLRFADGEVPLTEREAEIVAILLSRPNRTVTASEIIERSWGVSPDERHLQILRRHVSNIRRKLEQTTAASTLCTVRGAGYRFDVRLAG